MIGISNVSANIKTPREREFSFNQCVVEILPFYITSNIIIKEGWLISLNVPGLA